MNRRGILVVGLSVGLLALLLFSCRPMFGGKMESEPHTSFLIAGLDQRSEAFLSSPRDAWLCKNEILFSDVMRAAGVAPSVQNLTNLLSSSTRKYQLWDPYFLLRPLAASRTNALVALRSIWFEHPAHWESTEHPTLRVANDGQLALLWLGANAVIIFQDETNGMRESQYTRHSTRSPSGGSYGSSERGAPVVGLEPSSDASTAAAYGDRGTNVIAQLQGEWLLVPSAGDRRAPGPMKQIYDGDRVTTTLSGRPYFQERVVIDPSRTPKWIDFENESSTGEATSKRGILHLEGDTLKLCIGRRGGERPIKFAGPEEQGGGALFTFKRENVAVPAADP
jgi:uncharacterized protein (TIGR03067 family)